MNSHLKISLPLFVAGLALGLFSDRIFIAHYPASTDSRQVRGSESFEFINPLLECEVAEGTIDAAKINFKYALAEFTDSLISKDAANAISVYVRDLNNGPTFGVKQDEEYIPASLLKVPVMMAYLSYAEKEPSILRERILHQTEYEFSKEKVQHIHPETEIAPGESYTVEELIERMIVHSDNQATARLIENIPPRYIRELYYVLGVDRGVLDDEREKLSVKEYAAFFRILFNASYLSRENSEKALRLLSETQFDRGIVSGVPKGIVVSHKFGEAGDEVEHQIHDCGIVYYPGHPYLLCVMTRGDDIDTLAQTIGELSRFVWENFEGQYGGSEL